MALLCALALLFVPARAVASECTNSWTGPAEGSWQTATNWSAGHVPTSIEVACIGSGKTVSANGANQVAEVHAEGILKVTGGTFEVLNTEEASTVDQLRIESGTLTGAATIEVTGTLRWWTTMAGSGTTVIKPGAEAKVTSYWAYLKGRTLVNEGDLRLEEEGSIRPSEGAVLNNKGTIYANSVVSYARFPGILDEGGAPKVVNHGTILKSTASETRLNINLENHGTIDAQTGTLLFGQASGVGLWATGSVVKGKINVSGPTITLESVDADEAKLSGGSTFYAAVGQTAVLGDAETAVHSGPGTIEISGTVEFWATLSGVGTTVIRSGAEVKVKGYWAALKGRTLVNEGALRLEGEGSIRQSEGAILENKGTIYANSVISYARFPGIFDEGGSPKLVNHGTILKSVASETKLSINVENYGTINAQTGTLLFGQASGVGLWATGSVVKGNIVVSGPVITAESVDATEINLSGTSTLTAAAGETAQLGKSSISNLAGPGTFAITGSADLWTWSGSGTTVVKPGAEAKVTSYWSYLKDRTVVNEGDLRMEEQGTIRQSEGAVLENKGTLHADSVVVYARFPGILDEGGGSSVVNHGTIRKSKSTVFRFNTNLTNYGTIDVEAEEMQFESESAVAQLKSGSVLEGKLVFEGPAVTAENILTPAADLSVWNKSTMVVEGDIQLSRLVVGHSTAPAVLAGSGDVEVTDEFHWGGGGLIAGTGKLVLGPESVNKIQSGNIVHPLNQRRLVNEGTLSQTGSDLLHMQNGAVIVNRGTYNADSWPYCRCSSVIIDHTGAGPAPRFVNRGVFRRSTAAENTSKTTIDVPFENSGVIKTEKGQFEFTQPITAANSDDTPHDAECADPIDCATGNFFEIQTDLQVGGLGVGLDLTRAYSAQAAVSALSPGPFGYGWRSSFSDRLSSEEEGKRITLTRADGSTVPFTKNGATFEAPGWSRDELSGSAEAGYTVVTADMTSYDFSGSGRLQKVIDRNGNETALAYDEAGRLEEITDPSGRQLVFSYNGGGQVESVEDPMGNSVEYAYEAGHLAKVTMPGEEGPRWQFKYDASHRMTTMTDGRGGKTTNEYDASNRVKLQTDPAERTFKFEYAPFHTKVTNQTTGTVTDEWFTSNNQPYSITYAFGTASARTETFKYDEGGRLVARTDPAGRTTTYTYNAAGDRTSVKDPAGNETKWTYNSTHDVLTTTAPGGLTTTITRDAAGNPETVSRPAPAGGTQTTSFISDEDGQLESLTDPLERTWEFAYNENGDLVAETNPEGETQTWAYDENSQVTTSVSPRGNEEGAEAAEFTTTIARDTQGRPLKVTDPLGNAVEYGYDGNGNVDERTDPNGHTTTYFYNAVNEAIKTEKPNGDTTEAAYDGEGQVISQTNGNDETTTYVRNVLGQVTEVVDPLERKRKYEYDLAGNLKTVVDQAERETTYTYDAADRVAAIDYSSVGTPDASFEYDADGHVTEMVDGSGESSFEYDILGRLVKAEDGHGDFVEYAYNLADEQTGITYPNGKSVTRTFDGAGRMASVSDWIGGTTTFAYDADSNLDEILFPAGSGRTDRFEYDATGMVSDVTFEDGGEPVATIDYSRDKAAQIEGILTEGLPGMAEQELGYDENSRLVESSAGSYEYDGAGYLVKTPTATNSFNAAGELEAGGGVTYDYNALGERTEASPSSGPPTTYGYDQAGGLTSVQRAAEGEMPALSEEFTYDGTRLATSHTVGESTRHLTWDTSGGPALLLADDSLSYVYGPGGLPIAGIDSEEAPTYYHHDQLGSTRMLSNAAGESIAAFSYEAYGALEASAGAGKTPFGFAGQYTASGSGFQYLRARFYDSATAQFLTEDPLGAITGEPYGYGAGNPLSYVDRTGLGPCVLGFIACDEDDDPCDSLMTGPMLPACLVPEEAAPTVTNVSAGAGDALLSVVPGTDPGPWLRDRLGIDNVSECSAAYRFSRGFTEWAQMTKGIANGAEYVGRHYPDIVKAGRDMSRRQNERTVHLPPEIMP